MGCYRTDLYLILTVKEIFRKVVRFFFSIRSDFLMLLDLNLFVDSIVRVQSNLSFKIKAFNAMI